MGERQKLPMKFEKKNIFFLLAENNALTCSIFYAVQRGLLILLYTPLNWKFQELFNHI